MEREVYQTLLSNNAELSNTAANAEITDADFFKKLSDDEKNAIIKGHSGKSYDVNGNLLSNDNKVLLTAKELREKIAGMVSDTTGGKSTSIEELEAIEIEGVNYTINDKGEAIGTDGKVFKSKEELEALIAESGADSDNDEDSTDLTTLLNEASVITGYELTDDAGKPLTFEPTVEGLAERDKTLVSTYGVKIAHHAIESMFEKMPELKQLHDYVSLHGSAEGFTPGQQALNITINPNDDDQHMAIIVRGQMMKGNDAETAKAIAKAMVDDGKGADRAKAELEFINSKINASNQQVANQLAAKRQQEAAKQEAEFNAIKTMLDTGKIGDINIPPVIKVKGANGAIVQKSREDFLQFYTKPDATGKTAYEIANESKSTEQKLIDALLLFTNNDRESLLNAAATTQRIKLIKRSVAKGGSNASNNSNNSKGTLDINKIKI
jgi:hypothetical protein